MTWTRFMDMHSGGGNKLEDYEYIYVEAPEDEARAVMYNRFSINADRITCTCCGEDYSVSVEESLEQATAYDRNCEYDDKTHKYIELPRKSSSYTWKYVSLEDYLKSDEILVVYADSIEDYERTADIPHSGWTWV